MANAPYNRLSELPEIRKPSKVRRIVLIVLILLIILLTVVLLTIHFKNKAKSKDSHSEKTRSTTPSSKKNISTDSHFQKPTKSPTCTSPTCAGMLEVVFMANYEDCMPNSVLRSDVRTISCNGRNEQPHCFVLYSSTYKW